MTEHEHLLAAWRATQARLPPGWHLDALRCASTGLDAASRSDDWYAAAIGPAGARVERRAPDAIAALGELEAELVRHGRGGGIMGR
jgi:hypothetical protein